MLAPKALLLITAGKPTVDVIRAHNEQVTGAS